MSKYIRKTIEEYHDYQPETIAAHSGYAPASASQNTEIIINSENITDTPAETNNLEKLREIFVTNKEFKLLITLGGVFLALLFALLFLIPSILKHDTKEEISIIKNDIKIIKMKISSKTNY